MVLEETAKQRKEVKLVVMTLMPDGFRPFVAY